MLVDDVRGSTPAEKRDLQREVLPLTSCEQRVADITSGA